MNLLFFNSLAQCDFFLKIRKIISLSLAVVLTSYSFSQTAVAPAIGDGTAENPYQISSLENLYWLSLYAVNWSLHYVQTTDINASSTSGWDDGSGWDPIGDYTGLHFSGSYNGNGHKIIGLYINRYSNHQGFFGYIQGGNISNLVLTDLNITGFDNTGGIAALIGNAEINNCCCTGTINGNNYVGGLAGKIDNSIINNCFSTCNVQGLNYVGGLIGSSSYSTLNNCYNSGNIVSSSSYVGGLTGEHSFGSSIINCYNTGNISGNYRIGGLAGYAASAGVNKSYSTGIITGISMKGGLIGTHNNDVSITNSFWDTETSGQSASAGGTGKTTAQMKNIETYTDVTTEGLSEAWDFIGTPNNDAGIEDFWGINASINSGYPFLFWQCCGTSAGEVHPSLTDTIFPPQILNDPQNQEVCLLAGTSFQVDPVNYDDKTIYKWEMKAPGEDWIDVAGSIFSGMSTNELLLTGTTSAYDYYLFRCVLSNICGPPAISDSAKLRVFSAPYIITQPAVKEICDGENVSLTVEVSGLGVLNYRWKKNSVFISNWSTSPDYTLIGASISAAGEYSVLVKDGCGNTEESNSATLTVNPNPTVSLGADKHLCPGEYLTLNPGTGYSSYLWSTGATTQTIQVTAQGSYTVTVTNSNNCSNQASVFVTLDPAIPVPDLGADAEICQGQAKLLDASDQYDVYLWSTGSANSSILVNTTGTYWVEVRRNISVCVKRDSVDVFVQKPYEDEEICMVLIDPETEKNMIVWEKTEGVNTMKYQVYKKTGTTYTLVKERMFADSAWVIDYNSNPASQADAYVLVTIDNCGNSSQMSKWHKPFLLQSSLGFDVINLSWEPYLIDGSEVIAPDIYIFSNIDIFRGTTPTILEKIGSITAGIGSTSYIDTDPPADIKLYYRIGGEKDPPCNPNNLPLKKAGAGPFVHSFSNLEDNTRTTGTGRENAGNLLSIYPNPMADMAVIQVKGNNTFPVHLRVTDLSGRVLREQQCYENQIILHRENLRPGSYIVEVTCDKWYKGMLMVK